MKCYLRFFGLKTHGHIGLLINGGFVCRRCLPTSQPFIQIDYEEGVTSSKLQTLRRATSALSLELKVNDVTDISCERRPHRNSSCTRVWEGTASFVSFSCVLVAILFLMAMLDRLQKSWCSQRDILLVA